MCVCVCIYIHTHTHTHICKKVLSLGVSPERLKYSVVKPMFKKWDRSVISNKRLISLLPSCSKSFEKHIYATLWDHLNQHNILTPEQYGFRIKSSMKKASYSLLHEILLAMNSKTSVGEFSETCQSFWLC